MINIPILLKQANYKNINFIRFIPKEYFLIFASQIIPKIESQINNADKQKNWKNLFNHFIPKSHQNYSSDETYLLANNLTRAKIIFNTILRSFPNIDKDDCYHLVNHFLPLSAHLKIRVIQDDGTAIFQEIVLLMEYIKNIQDLIKRYKKPNSDYRGTAHRSSSLKKLVKTQINLLEKRLDGAYFRIQCADEIKHTEMMIKMLKASQIDEYKNLMELFNFGKFQFGLDMELMGLSEIEINALDQVLDFYNGIRTQPYELIRSVMIYMDYLFEKCELLPKEKANHIHEIMRFLFTDELKKAEDKRNKLAFNKIHVDKPYQIKTMLHQVPILAYTKKNSRDFFAEFIKTGINGILGLKNIFEPENPTMEETSWMHIGRSIISFRNEFGFTKKELKVLLSFIPKGEIEQKEKVLLLESSN